MDRSIMFGYLIILSITTASAITTTSTATTTPVQNQLSTTKGPPPRPVSSYEVTENVVDVPDDRTSPPIVPNYTIAKPFNVATNIPIDKNTKNDSADQNHQAKRTSFTYVHFTKEPENHEEGGIKKLIRGVKDYVYGLKRGVVDGLHSFFHSNDGNGLKKDKENNLYTKFQRSNVFEKEEVEDDFYDTFHRSDVKVVKNEAEIALHNFHRSYDSEESSHEFEHDEFKHDFEEYN